MLMLTTCCNEVSQHERVLSDIDSLLLQPGLTTAGADSARQMLLHMSQEMEDADEDTRAYYNLLRVKADERAKKKHVSDSLICTVVQHFEQHDPSGHLPEAYYVAGCVNSYLQNGEKALLYFQKALLCDSTRTTTFLKSRCYAQVGHIYMRNGLLQEALEMVCNEDEVFVMGGAAIYKLFLPFASILPVRASNVAACPWYHAWTCAPL